MKGLMEMAQKIKDELCKHVARVDDTPGSLRRVAIARTSGFWTRESVKEGELEYRHRRIARPAML